MDASSFDSDSGSLKPRSKAFAILPPWMRKALSGNKRFYTYTPEEIQRHLEGREMTARAGLTNAQLRQAERDEMRQQMGIERKNMEVLPHHYDLDRAGRTEGTGSGMDESSYGNGKKARELDGEYDHARAPIDPEAFK